MKRIVIFLLATIVSITLFAQTRREALLQYQANRQKALSEYTSNYRKACVEFMRKRWEAFNVEEPTALPERKEPAEPIRKRTADPVVEESANSDIADTTPAAPQPAESPKSDTTTPTVAATTPTIPTTTSTVPSTANANPVVNTSKGLKFAFYGTNCSVSFNSNHSINLLSLSESAVASAWQTLASGRFDKIYEESKAIKKQLGLNDWGYYLLVRTIADTCYGADSDKSILLQSFLLSEAGFKMRLARGDGRLRLLVSTDCQVYSRPYFKIGGGTFYLLDGKNKAARYEVCNFSIPGERPLSLKMNTLPTLTYRPVKLIRRFDKQQEIEINVLPNANLVSFLQDFPPCDWQIYASAQLSENTANSVLPALRKKIAGKTEREAAQILLSFIHNAFPYKADAQHFGTERTLFAEEVFAYKYSDCEDRSILFAQLVKRLLNLDVVLLHYPEHIATGVCFSGGAFGDSVQSNRKSYVVCDPTYVGADIGEAMPEYRNVSAKIVKID